MESGTVGRRAAAERGVPRSASAFSALRSRVDGRGKPAIGERPGGVLAHPADPDGGACPLADDAGADHPELPLRNVEHVIRRRFPLHLHREDEHVSPDSLLHAVFVTCRIELPRAEAPEH